MADFANIAEPLQRQAHERPYQAAIYQPSRHSGLYYRGTFLQLWDAISVRMAGLKAAGITRGMRTVLMVPPSIDFVTYTFALFRLGAVPVFVDPGIGLRHLRECLDHAAPEAFIGVPKACFARWLFGWARHTIRINLKISGAGKKAIDGVWVEGRAASDDIANTSSDDVAAILFTSGSTGVPKGAVYTHGMFLAQLESLRQTFAIEPGEYDLCTFPLFALFGPALGMTSVVPRMDPTRPAKVNHWEVILPVQNFGISNLFGSPALLNRVVRQIDDVAPLYGTTEHFRCPSLKRVLSAGAPVAPQILERFRKLLAPGVQIYTPYGATEALPVTVIGSDEVLNETRHKTAQGLGTCVGKPVAGIDVKIIRISDEPIVEWSDELEVKPGEIGEICVYGPVVTQEYFRRPDLTALAKIPDVTRGRKWHRMGDVGYFDAEGRLWFCGRKSQRVIAPARTYFTDPVEGIFNAHPAVFRSALVGVKRNGIVEPVLCVEREKTANSQADGVVAGQLLELGKTFELTREIKTILFHKSFPVDIRHNSKIFREKLAVWAQRQLR
jgi:olefin beta-lactone synthetase